MEGWNAPIFPIQHDNMSAYPTVSINLDKLHTHLHRFFERSPIRLQIRDSRMFLQFVYSQSLVVFVAWRSLLFTPFRVAKHDLSSHESSTFARRNMAFGASKAKLSQHERCLPANPRVLHPLPNRRFPSFRSLFRPFSPHNFLTKYPYNPPWLSSMPFLHVPCDMYHLPCRRWSGMESRRNRLWKK